MRSLITRDATDFALELVLEALVVVDVGARRHGDLEEDHLLAMLRILVEEALVAVHSSQSDTTSCFVFFVFVFVCVKERERGERE